MKKESIKQTKNDINTNNEINVLTKNAPSMLTSYIPAQEKIIEDLEAISLIKHDKKRLLLELLLVQEKTIMDLSNETGWNPGTVKRHLQDLEENGLIVYSKEEINEFNIKLKYYRTTAKQFKFQYIWPPNT